MAEGPAPVAGDKSASMRIDPALVRELAELLTDNDLTEIEVEDGDRKIKVKREPAEVIGGAPFAGPPFRLPRRRSPGRRHTARKTSALRPRKSRATSVKSPMVGTAFLVARARREAVHRRRHRP